MKKMKFSTLLVLTLLMIGLSFNSCQDEYENIITYGKLKVVLTDAPFPTDLVAETNVTINKIEIRKVESKIGGEDDIEVEAEENGGSPFIILSEEEQSFNLLDLTNGLTASLVDLEVETGSYDLIRLYVSESSVKLSDGTEYDLKVPSGAETGIKIFIKPSLEVSGGITAELLLDFDVSKSFVMQGNVNTPAGIKGFLFKPVIIASNTSTTGILQGMVTNSADESIIDGAQVSIMAADTVYKTSFTDETGAYTILGVEAGTYSLEFAKEGFEALTVADVEVSAANVTVQDVALVVTETANE